MANGRSLVNSGNLGKGEVQANIYNSEVITEASSYLIFNPSVMRRRIHMITVRNMSSRVKNSVVTNKKECFYCIYVLVVITQ